MKLVVAFAAWPPPLWVKALSLQTLFFLLLFSPNVTSIIFLNEEEKNEEKNARTGLSEKAAKLASSGVWH